MEEVAERRWSAMDWLSVSRVECVTGATPDADSERRIHAESVGLGAGTGAATSGWFGPPEVSGGADAGEGVGAGDGAGAGNGAGAANSGDECDDRDWAASCSILRSSWSWTITTLVHLYDTSDI